MTIPVMATTETPAEAPAKHRNVWIWVSAALCAVAIALLVWGLSTKSDLDSANQQVSQLKEQVDQGKHATSNAAASYQVAYSTIEEQLGVAKEDQAATEQDLKDAQAKADQAQQDAADAKSQTDKANADAQAAEEQLKVAQDCVKTFLSAAQTLAQSDNPEAEAEKLKPQLQDIAPDCKAALTG
jgi:preprotein translocase subunit SecF